MYFFQNFSTFLKFLTNVLNNNDEIENENENINNVFNRSNENLNVKRTLNRKKVRYKDRETL